MPCALAAHTSGNPRNALLITPLVIALIEIEHHHHAQVRLPVRTALLQNDLLTPHDLASLSMSTTMDGGSVMLRTEPMVPFAALLIGTPPLGAVVFVKVVVELDLAALVHFDELVEVRAGAEHPPRDRLFRPHAVLALYLVHVVPHVADRRLIISADAGNYRPACEPLHRFMSVLISFFALLCQADGVERAVIGELRVNRGIVRLPVRTTLLQNRALVHRLGPLYEKKAVIADRWPLVGRRLYLVCST